jgi:hypothetical protein
MQAVSKQYSSDEYGIVAGMKRQASRSGSTAHALPCILCQFQKCTW